MINKYHGQRLLRPLNYIGSLENKCSIFKRILKSEQLKQHIIAIVLGQLLSNSDMYEHRCLENIKKLFKSAGKCENHSQYKAIIKQLSYPLLKGSPRILQ